MIFIFNLINPVYILRSVFLSVYLLISNYDLMFAVDYIYNTHYTHAYCCTIWYNVNGVAAQHLDERLYYLLIY